MPHACQQLPAVRNVSLMTLLLAALTRPVGWFLLLGLTACAPGAAARENRDSGAVPHAGDLSSDTLAWVGPRAITAPDLVRRIEWMPWAEKRPAGMDSAKVRALQSLVGEALLAEEAVREALGDSGRVARMRAALRRALVRDALYREIAATAPAPDPAHVDRVVRARFPHATAQGRRVLRRAVTDSLEALAGRERAAEFMGRVLAPQRVVVDSSTFMLLADSLRDLMAGSRESRAAPKGYALLVEDVDVLLTRLGPELGRTLARLPGGRLELGDALEDLRFHSFSFHSLEPRRFAAELSARLKEIGRASCRERV